MKVTELRIGNLVDISFKEDGLRFIREINLVHSSFINAIQVPNYDGEIDTLDNINLIYGIPLSEDWFIKFGFKKTICGFERDDFPMSIEVDSIGYTTFGFEYYGGDKFEKEIKYVHQLQNLYFVLTGEELTYNK